MKILKATAEELFDHSLEISSKTIPFSSEVRAMCEQNSCGSYGKNWTCPPALPVLDELQLQLASFTTFLIIYKVYQVKSSFDWQGMMSGVTDFQARMLCLKKKIEAIEPKFDFLVLGAGACQVCASCSFPDGEPCRNPDDAIVSVEAYGIDVMKMMIENKLQYYSGKNTVTYIGGVFYRS